MNRQYTRAPHRSAASSEDLAPNAALLIDFDNVTMAIRSNLAQELENLLNSEMIRGKVAVQRAYADWRRYPQYIVPLSESSVDLIFAPAYGSSKKNATDIRLAIDALELVFTRPEIGTFILLSGDSDFSSLVLKLKEYGKYVIGVGLQESSSDILVQNCDEYYSYNTLSGLRDASEVESQRHDPWELVGRALRKMVDRSDVMRSDRLKQVMLELDPGFDEGAIGFSKFNRFLAEAASRDKVKLRKAANGQYEVGPVGQGSSRQGEAGSRPRVSRGRQQRSRPAEEPKRRSGARAARSEPGPTADDGEPDGKGVSASALRGAYELLSGAVRSLSKNEGSVRDSEVKRKMLAEKRDFDEAALGFRKFSRFLQQAHDEGVIDLRQGEDGNYYLSSVDDGESAGGERTAGRPAEREGGARGRRRGGVGGGARGRPETSPNGGRERATSAAGADASPETREAEDEETTSATPAGSRTRDREADPSERRKAARRGLGRFRRGSRGPSGVETGGAGKAVATGPVEVDGEPGEEAASGPAGDEAGEPADAASSPAASGSVRSGLGRFRRGSRGGAPEPAPSGSGDGSGDGSGSGEGPTGDREVIDHMVRNYPGVGERTAARLVEEFGGDVFEVIDREPERVTALLSDRRAQAVIEAREAEKGSS